MKIRTRLMLWYTALLLSGLLMVGGWSYYEIFVERRSTAVNKQLDGSPDSDLEEIGEIILYAGLPAMILALVGGWFLMKRALSPIAKLTEALERVHAGNLREQLPVRGDIDELDRLTRVFNRMTSRLDESFQKTRDFTLHASHELKTPLTILRGELETTLRTESLGDKERDRLASLLDEIERLTHLVEGLLFLSKADGGQIQLETSSIQLNELVQEAFADAQILAQPLGLAVRMERCDIVAVEGDRRRLRQLLLIFVDNATKYNQSGGFVSLSLFQNSSDAQILIANSGAGIPPLLRPKIFDYFVRGDASRSTHVEGCGLGLSIARWIVEAHRGSIQMTSEMDRVTTFTVVFPLSSNSPHAMSSSSATSNDRIHP